MRRAGALALLAVSLCVGCDPVPELYVVDVDASVNDGQPGEAAADVSADASSEAASDAPADGQSTAPDGCAGFSCPDCPPNPGMCCPGGVPCVGTSCTSDCATCASCTAGQMCCAKQGGPAMCRDLDGGKCP